MSPAKTKSEFTTFRLFSRFSLCVGMFLAMIVGLQAAEQRYLYVFRAPKDRDGFRTLKPSIEVHDIANGHKLLKVIPVTVPSGTRPVGDIRGVMANVKTKKIYISHYGATATDSRHSPGWVLCIDMLTNKPVWHKSYDKSVDRGALSPDGKTIYMPNGETSGLTYWHVIDAATGALKGKVDHIRQSHNTICSADGRVFLQGFGATSSGYSSKDGYRAPAQRMLKVYNPANGTSKLVGPFRETNRPFTINGKGSLVFMTVNDFIGFQVGDVGTGKVIFTCAPPDKGTAILLNGNTTTIDFKPAGDNGSTKCHGIAMTANEKYIYHVDNNHAGVHVWDVSGLPGSAPKWVRFLKGHSGGEKDSSGKKLYGENGIYGQPAWISSSYDGRYLYPETGEIIDTSVHKHVGQLKGANGKYTHSRFMLEIVFNDGTPVRAGDQFGVGRNTGTTVTPEPEPTVSKPAAPSSLMASTVSSSQINLAWVDNSSVETGFLVERSTDGTNFSQIASLGSNVKAYSSMGLSASKKYYYRVRAVNSAGYSSYSNVANATTTSGTKPAAPSSLKATGVSTSRVDMYWSDNSTDESGFKIERATDGVNFTQIATVGANVTQYSNTGLTSGKTYQYRVRAYNANGDSAYSNIDSGTPTLSAPAAPTSLVLSVASSSQINLAWTDASTVESGFKIERSTDGTNFSQIALNGANEVTYSSAGLTAGKKYYYRVRATNGAGDSAYSNIASATTKAASTADTQAPTAPSGLYLASKTTSSVTIKWNGSTDNVGVSFYKVYRNGKYMNGSSDTMDVDDSVVRGTTYSYYITAVDKAGNESAKSNSISVTP
jgi:hypothetical protein